MLFAAGERKAFKDGCVIASGGRWEPEQRLCRAGAFKGKLRQRLASALGECWDPSLFSTELLVEAGRIWREEMASADPD
eukprot:1254576-Karenia_brevis.AAC.1